MNTKLLDGFASVRRSVDDVRFNSNESAESPFFCLPAGVLIIWQIPPQWLALLGPRTGPPPISRSRLANARGLHQEDGPERTHHPSPPRSRPANEMRRVQRLTYRMRQLQVTHREFEYATDVAGRPDLAAASRSHRNAPGYMGLAEALVALQLVLKPAFDELFMTQFGRLARAAGDYVLDRIFSLNEDCAWHRAWSRSLMLTAIRDTPGSAPVIEGWIENWAPRVSRAVSAFRPIFDEMLPGDGARFATVLSEIEQFGQRYRESLFGRRAVLPGGFGSGL